MIPNNGNYKDEANKKFWDKISQKFLYIGMDFDPKRVALRIAEIYVLLGVLWVLFSDKLASMIVYDQKTLLMISVVKGWLYVFLTGIIIFSLIFSAMRKIKADEQKMMKNYNKLTTTHRALEIAHEEIAASEEELRQQFDSLMESQNQLAESEARYRLISEASNDGIWDEQDEKTYFSDRWLEITGYSREEIENLPDWKSLIHPEDYESLISIVKEHKEGTTPYYSCEYRLKGKNGQYLWVQTRGKAQFDENGNVSRMAGSHTDITKLKIYQQELLHNAYHDTLTGLPNRLALYKENDELLSTYPNDKFGMLFIDVDNFKFINDTLGHEFGDQLIRMLGKRLRGLLKKNCSLYRLNGDEFIIVISDIKEQNETELFAAQVLSGFEDPFYLGDRILQVHISIGISLYPQHGVDTNELLRCADIAMYRAKEAGRNRHMVYTQKMNEVVLERVLIDKHLRTALEKNEFELYYQPQLDLKENRITGLEALLRWNNKELGSVSPLKFIEIAEKNNLIMPLGTWVLNRACAFIKTLHEQGNEDLVVSVNVSMLQLLQKDFPDSVLEILKYYNLSPEFLELEITESILMESYETIEESLKLLCSKGIRIALDDFGKGYSSLSYLEHMPITTLKIDKSFIDDISFERENKSLTGQIVMMGKSLGLSIVAEGVETQDQLDYLFQCKCHKIQGYLFSKPLPEGEAEALVKNSMKSKS